MREPLETAQELERRPRNLAMRLARLARLIRDTVVEAFQEQRASEQLRGLYGAFQEALPRELGAADFADMFAQTVACGLFAARCNHADAGPFCRRDAVREIPCADPLLRRLFEVLADPGLDDEPFIGCVDELVRLLASASMDAVLANSGGKAACREDPLLHFYETFLTHYDPRTREARGVYYTPEPVVTYIVRSVDRLLRERFACPAGLADTGTVSRAFTDEAGQEQSESVPRVPILDPALGTGTFLYHVIEHIREGYRARGKADLWPGYVREHLLARLTGCELLMAPYATAHLKLGMQLAALNLPPDERARWTCDFMDQERIGIHLTNTLDEPARDSQAIVECTEVQMEQPGPIMVILGNPPYSNFGMLNKGRWILGLLEEYKRGLTEKKINLDDDCIKFIRFGQWKIEQVGSGIVAFVTNNTYIDGITHRQMRQSLRKTFSEIYILDLHGSATRKETTPEGGPDENVFDIQQGVAISIFVKAPGESGPARVFHADLWGTRASKYARLAAQDISTTAWEELDASERSSWLGELHLFAPQSFTHIDEYSQGWSLREIFEVFQNGVKTDRDELFFDLDYRTLEARMRTFYSAAGLEQPFKETYRVENSSSYDLLARRARTAFSAEHIRGCLYRPFDQRWLYYSPRLTSRPGWTVVQHMLAGQNLALSASRVVYGAPWRDALAVNSPVEFGIMAARPGNSAPLFPLYLYPTEQQKGLCDTPADAPGDRRPNLAAEFTRDVASRLNMRFVSDGRGDLRQTFGPEDIFAYIYAICYSPAYRERYAGLLKLDFPRLPLTSNADLFRRLCTLGQRLVSLHLLEQTGEITTRFPEVGTNLVEKIAYTCPPNEPERGRVHINATQYIEGLPPGVWEFHIGGYQVCEKWLKGRGGRTLTLSDIQHYQRLVAALAETVTLMQRIDEAIEEHGGWPIALGGR